MKKVFILLTAAFVFSFVAAQTSYSQQEGDIGRDRGGRGQYVIYYSGQWVPATQIGGVWEPRSAQEFNTTAAQAQGAVVNLSKVNISTGQAVPSTWSGDKVKVYRRTLCGDYRYIGRVNADNLNVPGDDYVLVKKCNGQYYWMRIAQ